jgi:uncharacterized membrane protein YgcG
VNKAGDALMLRQAESIEHTAVGGVGDSACRQRQCIGRVRSTRITIALWLFVALFLCLPAVGLAFSFPPLTGRVVDQAGIMTAQSRSELEAKLKNLKDKSGIQVVVATVKSLEGSEIETNANQLFSNWRLGEAKKNNGVLLLVASTGCVSRSAMASRVRCRIGTAGAPALRAHEIVEAG